MKKWLCMFLLAVLAAPGVVIGQGSLKGKLIDSVTKKPLTLASVTVFRQATEGDVARALGHVVTPVLA